MKMNSFKPHTASTTLSGFGRSMAQAQEQNNKNGGIKVAYSDYGSFVYKNGERREDKEDVGVFDTDEANMPSAIRIFANIMKRRESGNNDWFNHSHHGVMGDGQLRVGCYKQGWPTIYHWKEEEEKPTELKANNIIKMLGLVDKKYVWKSDAEYHFDYDYPLIDFEYEGYKFSFVSSDYANHYEAEMTEPDGTNWKCVYDYDYGAGFEE